MGALRGFLYSSVSSEGLKLFLKGFKDLRT